MGTSMELRLSADSEELARRAEDRVLREIDRLSAIFSGYDPTSEFSRWMAGPRAPVEDRARAVRGPPALRPMADSQRRRVRPESRGPDAALVAMREGRPDADASRDRRGQGRARSARLAARLIRDDRRAALRRPADPERDRQGIHRRAGVRRRDGGRWPFRHPRRAAQRGRRPARLRRARPHHRHRRPARRQRDLRADRLPGGPRQGCLHQRQLPARVPDWWPMVLSQAGPPDRHSRRTHRLRDGHRRSVRRRRRPRHDLQRAPPRGQRAVGTGDPRRRMPDRLGRRPRHPQRRLGPLRAAGAWTAGARARARAGPRRRSRPMASRGARHSSCS